MTHINISPSFDPKDNGEAVPSENDLPAPGESMSPAAEPAAGRAIPYVPRVLQQHLVDDPGHRCWTGEGSAAFVDISKWTRRRGANPLNNLFKSLAQLPPADSHQGRGDVNFPGRKSRSWLASMIRRWNGERVERSEASTTFATTWAGIIDRK